MSDTPSLERLQRRFWQLISAPTGVAEGLDALVTDDPQARPLTGWIAADGEAHAVERLDVYANMYFHRLHDSLAEDFPNCQALIGGARFHNLVTDYLLAHPPDDPSLRYAGRALPDFVDKHELAASWPALGDLARLEWTRTCVFEDGDAEPLAPSSLARLTPEQWPELMLAAIPAARLLRVGHAVQDVWRPRDELHSERANETAASADATGEPAQTMLLIWRREFFVYHRPVADDEACALRLLCATGGASFAAICDAIAAPRQAPEVTAQRAVRLLEYWLRTELVRKPT